MVVIWMNSAVTLELAVKRQKTWLCSVSVSFHPTFETKSNKLRVVRNGKEVSAKETQSEI